MSDMLTLAEIEAHFVSEWVLIEDPQTNNALEVQSGKVLYHSKDRDEVYRRAVAAQTVCHAVYRDAPQGYGDCAMSIPLNPQHGLVIVRAAVDGRSGSAVLRLALDTGVTGTVINVGMLVALGYDSALVPERIQVTTGSGVEFVPQVSLHKIVALGQERTNFPVLGHTLPSSASIDGVLGLDFVRGQTLTVDFRTGTITLT